VAGEPPNPKRDWLIAGAVLLLTVVCFAGVVRHEFVFDDDPLIKENPRLRSWSYFPGYFQLHLAGHIYPIGNYYRPVLLTWMRVNYVLFGLEPAGWHAGALLAHLACTLLVYFIARRITGHELAAAGSAALFGLHPVHVECVAWIMGVTEPLAAALTLGAFLAYLRWREADGAGWPWAAVVLLVLGLLAKENAIVLPGIIFVYEFLRGRKAVHGADASADPAPPALFENGKEAFRRVLPFALAITIYLVVRLQMLGALAHPMTPLPAATTLLTIPSVLVFYWKLLLWPLNLSVAYELPYITEAGAAAFWLPLLICLTLGGALMWASWRNGRVAVAAAWLVLPMIPLLNLGVFPRGEAVHDRYLYFSSVGFCLLLGLALGELQRLAPRAPAALALGSALALAYGVISFDIKTHWRDNLSLYTRGHAVAPGNSMSANNLGRTLFDMGKEEEGRRLFLQVIERDPNYWVALFNLGFSEYRRGNYPQAEEYLRRAIAAEPREPDPYVRLGVTLWRLGRTREGVAAIEHAIRLRPTGQGYHFALGVILEANGLLKEALFEFDSELAVNANQPAVRKQRDALAARLK
jgi:hypothetical protein